MEKKLLLICLIGIIITIIIFNITSIDKINYTTIGDSVSYGITSEDIHSKSYSEYIYENLKYEISEYNSSYAINNLSVRDLYDLLVLNETLDNESKTIQQIIHESNIITIAIGYDELKEGTNTELYLYYFELIINKITNLTNANIYILSVPIFNDEIDYINNNIEILSNSYDCTFVSLEEIIDTTSLLKDNMYLSQNFHESLANQILTNYKYN